MSSSPTPPVAAPAQEQRDRLLHRLWQSPTGRKVMGLPGLRLLDDKLESDQLRKMLRYAGVSLFFVPVGQILIQVLAELVFEGKNNFTWASIASAGILTLPNFFANKIFVWQNTSRDNLRTQVLVFWVAALLGVSFATGFTFLVEQWVHGANIWLERGAVFFAQLTGFGLVWVGRFLILDKWLFKVTHHGDEPSEDDLDELHADFPI